MKYKKFGRTDLEISEISLGTWAFASGAYGKTDDKVSLAAIDAAIDLGINLFDAAPLYSKGDGDNVQDGYAEIVLGKGLKGRRDKAIISTKFGRNPSMGWDTFFNKKRVISSVEESLKRLGTDYIDVLFFHSPFGPDQIESDVWEGLQQVKEQGKVRYVGHSISMFEDTQAMNRQWMSENKIDVTQLVYSLMSREADDLIQFIGEQNGGVLARESLANGFLTGAITKDTVFEKGSVNAKYTAQEIAERVRYADSLDFLIGGQIKTPAQAALRWVLDSNNVSSVLSGAMTREQIEDCAKASDANSFTPEMLNRAKEIHKKDFSAA